MSCTNPNLAVNHGYDPITGKYRIKFLPNRFRVDRSIEDWRRIYGDNLLTIPCGKCAGCLQDKARMWSSRCSAEASMYKENCFLTLTYRKAPPHPIKNDVAKFIRRINRYFGKKVKYFACGELGNLTSRSHYHVILFGVDFPDKVPVANCRTYLTYGSKIAERIWKNGFVMLGNVDNNVSMYVSQYVFKKQSGEHDPREFLMFSPGLGSTYFEAHKDELFDSDYLYIGDKKFTIPRYFVLKAKNGDNFEIFMDSLEYLERKRKRGTSIRFNKVRSVCEDHALIQEEVIHQKEFKDKLEKRDMML